MEPFFEFRPPPNLEIFRRLLHDYTHSPHCEMRRCHSSIFCCLKLTFESSNSIDTTKRWWKFVPCTLASRRKGPVSKRWCSSWHYWMRQIWDQVWQLQQPTAWTGPPGKMVHHRTSSDVPSYTACTRRAVSLAASGGRIAEKSRNRVAMSWRPDVWMRCSPFSPACL